MKKKYFLEEEFWETISKTKVFDTNTRPNVSEYRYKCSGAVYSGQWIGGFRHGEGTMTWNDGA